MTGFAREIEIDDEWKQRLEEACDDIRAETIEQCAKAAEKAWPRAHTYASENADLYRGQDHAVRTVVKAIRALALPRPASNSEAK